MRFTYVLGSLLIIGGLVAMYLQAGLAAWIPLGAALAGLAVVTGLLFVGAPRRAKPGRDAWDEEIWRG